ncbi:MAG TPA: hypothetical protein VK983_05430 [Candidatus Limnocylindrales bacterium]|nr:hypothetical protein [Candidatus Limnocylindrales bacterium]
MLGFNEGPILRTFENPDLYKEIEERDRQERLSPTIVVLPPQPTDIGLKSSRIILDGMQKEQDD